VSPAHLRLRRGSRTATTGSTLGHPVRRCEAQENWGSWYEGTIKPNLPEEIEPRITTRKLHYVMKPLLHASVHPSGPDRRTVAALPRRGLPAQGEDRPADMQHPFRPGFDGRGPRHLGRAASGGQAKDESGCLALCHWYVTNEQIGSRKSGSEQQINRPNAGDFGQSRRPESNRGPLHYE